MKVLQLYNQQRSVFGGEESVISAIRATLERHGQDASVLSLSSRGIERSWLRKISAAASGIFNPFAYRAMRSHLRRDRPDLVHVHSVFPRFSPRFSSPAAVNTCQSSSTFTATC